MEELREELAAQGIVLAYARAKRGLARFFSPDWLEQRRETFSAYDFPTVRAAVIAFKKRHKSAPTTEPAPQPEAS